MNREILSAALNSIDATFIEEHAEETNRLKARRRITNVLRTLGSAAACLAIFALAITLWNLDRFGSSGTDAQPPSNNAGQITTTPIDGAAPPTDSGTRLTLTFGGKTYTVLLYPDGSPANAVSEENIGDSLGKATVLGLGEATECEIYSVTNRDDALAVLLPNGEYALALIPRMETIN